MADNKLDVILATLQNGPISRKDLIAAAGTTPNALASYFTSLRLAAKFSPEKVLCPMNGEGDTIVLGTYPEYEAQQAASTAKPKVAKTPQAVYLLAEKNVTRALKAVETLKAEGDTSDLGKLYVKRAELNVKIYTLELTAAKDAFDKFMAENPDTEVEADAQVEGETEAEEIME